MADVRDKWPYRADGDTVRDMNGAFVAAARSEKAAKLLAASPWLYLFWKAASEIFRNAGAGCAPHERQINRVAGYSEKCAEALEGWRP